MWDKTESTLIGDIAKDGLDIVNIDCKLKALKEARIPRLLNSKGILFNMKNSYCNKVKAKWKSLAIASRARRRRED